MQKFIILHSNDIHGRIEGLARIATLVERVRAENPDLPVLYLDAGDSEETSTRLSNLTKGVAMYRLLRAAGCAVATIGNGGLSRYSQYILPEYARAAGFPLLLGNLRNHDGSHPEGVQATTILNVGTFKLGIIGVTAPALGGEPMYEDFGLNSPPVIPLAREIAAELRQQGANVVILLSHLGLPEDAMVSLEARNMFSLIVGAHTHNLIPAGVWTGKTLIAQAGEFAEHLGRLDLAWDGEQLQVERVSVIPVAEDIPPSPRVQAERAIIEAEVEQSLNSGIGELADSLDFSFDRECGTANLMADALRERMEAEVAIVTAAMAPAGAFPAGPLKRIALWEICSSPANPGVVQMTGEQLSNVVRRGLDPILAADRPRANRGNPRGLMHLSGASMRAGQLYIGTHPVEPARVYKVAGSDWELGRYGGYVEAAWRLKPTYEIQTIMRDVVEDYLKGKPPVTVEMGRLG
jgi:2',3'-cyclic-nucleotide 2'-phosphodiesterase (5'-nucleotidase family)